MNIELEKRFKEQELKKFPSNELQDLLNLQKNKQNDCKKEIKKLNDKIKKYDQEIDEMNVIYKKMPENDFLETYKYFFNGFEYLYDEVKNYKKMQGMYVMNDYILKLNQEKIERILKTKS